MPVLRIHGYALAVSFCLIIFIAASQRTDPSEGEFADRLLALCGSVSLCVLGFYFFFSFLFFFLVQILLLDAHLQIAQYHVWVQAREGHCTEKGNIRLCKLESDLHYWLHP